MRAQWKCDKCPTVGHLTPKTEHVQENYEVTIPGSEGPEREIRKRHKMASLRTQDTHTGKMYDHPVVATKDIGVRISIIQLRVGDEMVAIQLCHHCLNSFRPHFTALWNEMEGVVNAH